MEKHGPVTLVLLILCTLPVVADDLIVRKGESKQLAGNHTFTKVHIQNGGVLQVTPYNGTSSSGILELHADTIQIDEGGRLSADGSGHRGIPGSDGEGPGKGRRAGPQINIYSGASGGGYGETGQRGVGPLESINGGSVVGADRPWFVELGSAGGGYLSYDYRNVAPANYHAGGNGGGCIHLYARTVLIQGQITANGSNAIPVNQYGYAGAGGGGSGGGIFVSAQEVTGSGNISANGGEGSTDYNRIGGAGGGGRIAILYSKKMNLASKQLTGTPAVFTSIHQDITFTSSTHPNPDEWYSNNEIQCTWSGPPDYPILGYRYALVTNPNSVTMQSMSSAAFTAANRATFSNQSDGTYYLFVVHVLTNSSTSLPLQSFRVNVDTKALPPVNLRSPTHSNPMVSYRNRDGFLEWDAPSELSGVAEYAVALTSAIDAPKDIDSYSRVSYPRFVFQNLEDGTFYIHIRTIDKLGHISSPAIYRLTVGSASPPTPTPQPLADLVVTSSTHPNPQQWYTSNFVQLEWEKISPAEILGYKYILLRSSALTNSTYLDANGTFTTKQTIAFSELDDGEYYFYIAFIFPDSSLSDVFGPYTIQIDSTVSPPRNLRSPTHPNPSQFYLQRDGYFEWNAPTDRTGVHGYLVAMTQNSEPPESNSEYSYTTATRYVFTDLPAGIHNIYVKTVDVMGNESTPATFQINIAVQIVVATPTIEPTPTATPIPPRADAGTDIRVPFLGASAVLNGSKSTGNGSPIEEYSWREDPDNPVRGLIPSYIEEPNVEIIPPRPGLYRFTLVIRTLLQNSAPDSVLVYVPGIAGHVTIVGTNVPIAGAVILNGSRTAVTNAQGEYVLYGSHEGESQIEATHSMFDPFIQTLFVNASGLIFNFSMTGPHFIFNGKVVDSSDRPIDQVTVKVEPYTSLATSTDINGQFYFGDIPFGSRLVSFTKSGYGSIAMPMYFGRDVTDLIVRMLPGGSSSLQGRVLSSATGLPMSGIEVSWGSRYETVSDRDGRYAFLDILSGSNVIRAEGFGILPYYQSLEIPRGGTIYDILVDEPSISIGGELVYGGSPVTGARILVQDGLDLEATTDGTGYFFFPHISAGKRNFVVTLPSGETRIFTHDIDIPKDILVDFNDMETAPVTAVEQWLKR